MLYESCTGRRGHHRFHLRSELIHWFMGEDRLRVKPEYSPPQSTERSTAEITAQRCNELRQDSASNELQLELVVGLPERRPDGTPIPRPRASSPRLAHTLPRRRPPNAVPALALSDVKTRPASMRPERPRIAALQNLPPPVEALASVPPLVAVLQNVPPPAEAPSVPPLVEALQNLPPVESPSDLPPPIEAHWSMPSRVGAPPKWPPAPRTLGDRLALPAMLFVLALGAGAFLLLR